MSFALDTKIYKIPSNKHNQSGKIVLQENYKTFVTYTSDKELIYRIYRKVKQLKGIHQKPQ
jgi:hypothetical protein